MLAVRRQDELVFRRKVDFTMDSKGTGDVAKADEDNVNLDKN